MLIYFYIQKSHSRRCDYAFTPSHSIGFTDDKNHKMNFIPLTVFRACMCCSLTGDQTCLQWLPPSAR